MSGQVYNVKDLLTEGEWEGERVFIVGGGSSLDDFDFSLLDGERVIAVNSSHVRGVPDLVVTGDRRWVNFYLGRTPKQYPVVYCRRKLANKPMLKVLARDVYLCRTFERKTRWGRSFDEGVVPGDSGLRAVNVAAIMGAAQICLLGFDMGKKKRQEWWHEGYPRGWSRDPSRYERFCLFWENLIHNDGLPCDIVNLNPKSNLACIPKATLDYAFSGK